MEQHEDNAVAPQPRTVRLSRPVRSRKRQATTTKRDVARVAKQRQALALRQSGATFDQIARAVGYKSASAASYAVRTALKQSGQEAVADLVSINFERLNFMLLTIWPQVQLGDLSAISKARQIMHDMNNIRGAYVDKHEVDVNVTGGLILVSGDPAQYSAALKEARQHVLNEIEAPAYEVQSPAEIDAEFAEYEAARADRLGMVHDEAEVVEDNATQSKMSALRTRRHTTLNRHVAPSSHGPVSFPVGGGATAPAAF